MDKQELQAELDILFNPQPDEDGFFPPEYLPERITKSHKLDISYMDRLDYEGSTIHPYTRICRLDEHRLISLSRNHDVSQRLFKKKQKIPWHSRKKKNRLSKYGSIFPFQKLSRR